MIINNVSIEQLNAIKQLATTAQNLANAAMPKSGGTFTGPVHGVEHVAWKDNSFRNAWVTDANGSAVTTEYIWYRRQ